MDGHMTKIVKCFNFFLGSKKCSRFREHDENERLYFLPKREIKNTLNLDVRKVATYVEIR